MIVQLKLKGNIDMVVHIYVQRIQLYKYLYEK